MLEGSTLSDLRVLEYGDMVSGPYCARLLADAGADVVKLETPEGDASRKRGPFPDGVTDHEWSGLYLYLNANKRGITLDIEQQSDLEIFHDLLRHVDVLVINRSIEFLERFGLRWRHLKQLNPRLIVTIITPFGLTGPYRNYAGDDLIAISAGGLAYATPGSPDMVHDADQEPPLRANTYVGEFLAGIQGSIATLAAVMTRNWTGEGGEVDLSQQEAVATILNWELAHASYLEPKRRRPMVSGRMPNAYMPCKDGYVVVMASMESHWQGLVEMMGSPDWSQSEVFGIATERARNWDALEPLLLEWTMNHTGEEIARMAQSKGVPFFPAYRVGQMVESDQVAARKFLWNLEAPNGQKFQLPGYPIRMEGHSGQLRRPAPRLGEHSAQVLEEWLGNSTT